MSMEPEPDDGVQRSGAWKVAYADFVTALMALFIVLWLMNSSNEVKDAVSSYFRSPRGHDKLTGTAQAGAGQSIHVNPDEFAELRKRLERALQEMPELRNLSPNIRFTVTGEGLRIEIMENFDGVFFENASSRPTGDGLVLFQTLAREIAALPNDVVLEGHTDSKPFRGGDETYGNWELSFDRANMTRRVMLANGVRPEQIAEIRGYADRQPVTADSSEAKNRRISVILLFLPQ